MLCMEGTFGDCRDGKYLFLRRKEKGLRLKKFLLMFTCFLERKGTMKDTKIKLQLKFERFY